jgi:SAM-dependent methyltransferase
MRPYDFQRQVSEWSHPPVDDVGYISSDEMLGYSDRHLKRIIDQMEVTRYTGWRNHQNRWRSSLGLDTTRHKMVLDFGCGVGLESLQFAQSGNEVIVADISAANILLADRVLKLYGYEPRASYVIDENHPFIPDLDTDVDIFYCNGVLHHIPYDVEVMTWAAEIAPEARLMLYSDVGWRTAVGSPTPVGRACNDPRFDAFVRFFDSVGEYADFYSAMRIEVRFGLIWDLVEFSYICGDDRYCTATLRRKT